MVKWEIDLWPTLLTNSGGGNGNRALGVPMMLSSSRVLYTAGGNGPLYALSADTGTVIWSRTDISGWTSDFAEMNGLLFFGSADTNALSSQMRALVASTGADRWSVSVGYPNEIWDMAASSFGSGTVFFGQDSGHLVALDAASGSVIWDVGGFPSWIRSSPVIGPAGEMIVEVWGSGAYIVSGPAQAGAPALVGSSLCVIPTATKSN